MYAKLHGSWKPDNIFKWDKIVQIFQHLCDELDNPTLTLYMDCANVMWCRSLEVHAQLQRSPRDSHHSRHQMCLNSKLRVIN